MKMIARKQWGRLCMLLFVYGLWGCTQKPVPVMTCVLPDGNKVTVLSEKKDVQGLGSGRHLFFFAEDDEKLMRSAGVSAHFSLEVSFNVLSEQQVLPASRLALGVLYQRAAADDGVRLPPLIQVHVENRPITLAMQLRTGSIPTGCVVVVPENMEVEITAMRIIPARRGWVFSDRRTVVYAGEDGGSYDTHADVCKKPIRMQNEEKLIIITKGMNGAYQDNPQQAAAHPVITAGDRTISLYDAPASYTTELPAFFFPAGYAACVDAARVQGMYTELHNMETTACVDPFAMLSWDQKKWRQPEFEYFRWDRFSSVLVFDFKNHAVQNAMLKRLAFFVEKKGFAGKLWTNSEIEHLHGFNANDFKADDVAAFFSAAEKENFLLNPEEVMLRTILIREGCIKKTPAGFSPIAGAVLSVSRQTSVELRRRLLAHEGFHGIYFSTPDFREFTKNLYSELPVGAAAFIETFFGKHKVLRYDISNQYLLENEFMAYILQQPLSHVRSYFTVNMAGYIRRRLNEPTVLQYINNTAAQEFMPAARALNKFVYRHWGLSGGRVWGLTF